MACIPFTKLSINCLFAFVAFLSFSTPAVEGQNWSCAINATGFQFDVTRISGDWYETARIPQSDVPACVRVTAPEAISSNNSYDLQVNFINNVNSQWKRTAENVTFPWNNSTKDGTFTLNYGTGSSSISVIFKLVTTDYDSLAIVCGYSGVATVGSLVKILTRDQQVNSTIRNQINALANTYGVASDITWVEQSSKCNSAARTLPVLALFFAVFYGNYKLFNLLS